jgi:hypothetical protein
VLRRLHDSEADDVQRPPAEVCVAPAFTGKLGQYPFPGAVVIGSEFACSLPVATVQALAYTTVARCADPACHTHA